MDEGAFWMTGVDFIVKFQTNSGRSRFTYCREMMSELSCYFSIYVTTIVALACRYLSVGIIIITKVSMYRVFYTSHAARGCWQVRKKRTFYNCQCDWYFPASAAYFLSLVELPTAAPYTVKAIHPIEKLRGYAFPSCVYVCYMYLPLTLKHRIYTCTRRYRIVNGPPRPTCGF